MAGPGFWLIQYQGRMFRQPELTLKVKEVPATCLRGPATCLGVPAASLGDPVMYLRGLHNVLLF